MPAEQGAFSLGDDRKGGEAAAAVGDRRRTSTTTTFRSSPAGDHGGARRDASATARARLGFDARALPRRALPRATRRHRDRRRRRSAARISAARRPTRCRTSSGGTTSTPGSRCSAAGPSGRGAAADSVSLPGVWAEVDVNGGPRAARRRRDDGAPTIEVGARALRTPCCNRRSSCARATACTPTGCSRRRSTYASPSRARAGRPARRGLAAAATRRGGRARHRRARRDARPRARVPAGRHVSTARAGEPVPSCSSTTAARATRSSRSPAEVLAPVVPIVDADARGAGARAHARRARRALLGARRIARREGKAPGDGSRVDMGLLPRVRGAPARETADHARRGARARRATAAGGDDPRGKGTRRDYLERTVDKAFDEVRAPDAPEPKPAALMPETAAAFMTARWRVDRRPDRERLVDGPRARRPCSTCAAQSGDVVRFRRFGDLFDATRHVASRVAPCRRARARPRINAGRCASRRRSRALCGVRDRDERDRDEVEVWLDAFVHGLGAIIEGDLLGEGEPRWRVLVAQRDYTPSDGRPASRRRPPAFATSTVGSGFRRCRSCAISGRSSARRSTGRRCSRGSRPRLGRLARRRARAAFGAVEGGAAPLEARVLRRADVVTSPILPTLNARAVHLHIEERVESILDVQASRALGEGSMGERFSWSEPKEAAE